MWWVVLVALSGRAWGLQSPHGDPYMTGCLHEHLMEQEREIFTTTHMQVMHELLRIYYYSSSQGHRAYLCQTLSWFSVSHSSFQVLCTVPPLTGLRWKWSTFTWRFTSCETDSLTSSLHLFNTAADDNRDFSAVHLDEGCQLHTIHSFY